MAWPKPRNRRSPVPTVTFSKDGGAASDESRIHVAPVEQAATPSRRSLRRWPGGHGRPAETHPQAQPAAQPPASLSESLSEGLETEPDDAPFWAGWAPADESISLDDPGDGLPEDGPADDAVTDVDPRPRPSWKPVITPVDDAREQADGIGQHPGGLAHLRANPRMRVWRRRVIVAVIAGVAFGYLLHDWRWGLTFAVLAGIADTIVRSRTTFKGPAGVRLTGAQKRTVRQLSSLERRGYRAMHILPIPDSTEQIDHLVIGPAGVFAIDSEDWDRRLPVRTSSHRNLWHGPHNMKDRLVHARWEADQAAALLSAAAGSPVTVRAAMAVYGPKIMWDVAEIRDVDVFSGPRLRKYLRRRARRRDAHPLSPSEIERIDKAAHTAFPQPPRAGLPSR
jgi:Nuclease-related domain